MKLHALCCKNIKGACIYFPPRNTACFFYITLIQCLCKESFLIAHALTKLLVVMLPVCVMPVSQASQRARQTATYVTTVESCSRANHIRWSAFINFKAS